MSAATMPVNRLGPNNATAGIRYTNAGMVCAMSSNGRRAAENRPLRAEAIPRTSPRARVIAVATRTDVRVSMLCSQS